MKPDRSSATARLIAESLAVFAADKTCAPLVPREAARLSKVFADAGSMREKTIFRAKQSTLLQPLFAFLENRIIPGIRVHYALRKLRIEEIARAAALDDFKQIAIFGAGFDTLALRLHLEFANVRFVEIDFPATQYAKRRIIPKNEFIGNNLFFQPADLTENQNFSDICKSAEKGFRADLKTLFVAEGLLMYFSPAEIDRLFAFVRANSAPNSLFAFTFMEKRENGEIGFQNASRAVDWWLKQKGEPFKSGFRVAELKEFLNARGFALESLDQAVDLRRRYLSAPELQNLKSAAGESLCVAAKI